MHIARTATMLLLAMTTILSIIHAAPTLGPNDYPELLAVDLITLASPNEAAQMEKDRAFFTEQLTLLDAHARSGKKQLAFETMAGLIAPQKAWATNIAPIARNAIVASNKADTEKTQLLDKGLKLIMRPDTAERNAELRKLEATTLAAVAKSKEAHQLADQWGQWTSYYVWVAEKVAEKAKGLNSRDS